MATCDAQGCCACSGWPNTPLPELARFDRIFLLIETETSAIQTHMTRRQRRVRSVYDEQHTTDGRAGVAKVNPKARLVPDDMTCAADSGLLRAKDLASLATSDESEHPGAGRLATP